MPNVLFFFLNWHKQEAQEPLKREPQKQKKKRGPRECPPSKVKVRKITDG